MLIREASHPGSIRLGWITIDRLGASISLLVAVVGAVTFRFSQHYLAGEPGQDRFLRQLAATIAVAYLLMISTNLVLFFAAWSLTSLILHRLLIYYPDRIEAVRAARKSFLINRVGDFAIIGAIWVIWRVWGTLDMHVFLEQSTLPQYENPAQAVALLITLAALTKSAQVPFHSWLPETMESPTPVSALMHAGIINAGGVLLLRFAPLVAREPAALILLSAVGTLTAALGLIAMWAQVKVKRSLAWSTVAQMGFMMVQCGLGAFHSAAMHLVGHGLYKAWNFLRAADLQKPTPHAPDRPPLRALGLTALGTAFGIPALWVGSRITGFDPWRSPGEMALASIVALSIGQFWAEWPGRGLLGRVVGAPTVSLFLAVVACALYHGAEIFLEPVLGDLPSPQGPWAWVAAALPVVAFAGLCTLHAFLPTLGRIPSGRAFRVHALHGFYFGSIADRLVSRAWSLFGAKTEVTHV
ncbi:proton-conducting transporter membrane subunit [Tundrisphaera sp. TA3]|uniref:proton-conducting transporter transmembrane domain-containing protein n=1 Tax=Tundrisphaera sp. TA3 TaxID=3435775 RepID=UPI003EBA60E3